MPGGSSSRADRWARGTRGEDGDRRPGIRYWIGAKRPVFRFVVIFCVLMGLFYGVFYMPLAGDSVATRFFVSYLRQYAAVSGAILRVLGQDVTVTGQSISSERFSVKIVRGCDAMDATALFVCAVIAVPVRWWRKLAGVAVGVLVLAVINLARIVSLFYVGVYFPDVFETMHMGVWQVLVVVSAVLIWTVWAWWAMRGRTVQDDVPA